MKISRAPRIKGGPQGFEPRTNRLWAVRGRIRPSEVVRYHDVSARHDATRSRHRAVQQLPVQQHDEEEDVRQLAS
jgi:hypothetical protein